MPSSPALVAALSTLVGALPGVEEKRTEAHVSFMVAGKMFAFTRSTGDGVALKLSRQRIAELAARKDIAPLTMGKRTMKEWILLTHARPSDYSKDLPLFEESLAFTAAGKKR